MVFYRYVLNNNKKNNIYIFWIRKLLPSKGPDKVQPFSPPKTFFFYKVQTIEHKHISTII